MSDGHSIAMSGFGRLSRLSLTGCGIGAVTIWSSVRRCLLGLIIESAGGRARARLALSLWVGASSVGAVTVRVGVEGFGWRCLFGSR